MFATYHVIRLYIHLNIYYLLDLSNILFLSLEYYSLVRGINSTQIKYSLGLNVVHAKRTKNIMRVKKKESINNIEGN